MKVLAEHCWPLARFRCRDNFGVATKEDNPDVQPPSFCRGCYMLVHSRKAREENRVYTPTVQLFSWSAHTEHSYSV